MATIAAGTSQDVTIAPGRVFRIRTAGEAYVDVKSGLNGAGYSSIRLKDNRLEERYGPSSIQISLTVRAISGVTTATDVTAEGGVSTVVDSSGNVIGLVGPDGNAVVQGNPVSMAQISAGPTEAQIAVGNTTRYRVSDGPSAGAVVTVAIPSGGTSPAFVWDIWPQSQFVA